VLPSEVAVFSAGSGPFALMFANELSRRGVPVLLVDSKDGAIHSVQANAIQARTQEYYRRLGFADEVRALGMSPNFPITRFAGHELARFSLPSARDAHLLVKTLSGSWSAAELPHRCNQKFIEPVLQRHAECLGRLGALRLADDAFRGGAKRDPRPEALWRQERDASTA
jgi:hypothetical protein